MKFFDEMSKEEKKQNIIDWIENFKQTRDFSEHEDLKLAMESLKKGDLEYAANILSNLTKEYEIKVYDNFKKFLERLTISKDKKLEEEIKRAFSLKDAHTANYSIHQAIEEKKVKLTEDELKLVNEFARECT